MIVEGYDLNLYCDGDHGEWELSTVNFETNAVGEFGGRNKSQAWNQAKRLGWTKRRNKVYCPDCSKKRNMT